MNKSDSDYQKGRHSFSGELTADTRTVMAKKVVSFFQEKLDLSPQVMGPNIFPEQGPA